MLARWAWFAFAMGLHSHCCGTYLIKEKTNQPDPTGTSNNWLTNILAFFYFSAYTLTHINQYTVDFIPSSLATDVANPSRVALGHT